MENKVKPTANSSIVFREESDDWAILFDPETGDAFGINPIGAFIWKRLSGRHSLKDIEKQVHMAYKNIPEHIDNHVREFIAGLCKNGLANYES